MGCNFDCPYCFVTQEIADMLGRCKVTYAQITLDGIGPEHDKTRRLAGGGPAYDSIVENLRALRLPFRVDVRHNVHEGNKEQVQPLRDLVKALSEESGNKIDYYPSPVEGNSATDQRGGQVGTLCGAELDEIELLKESHRFQPGHGI